MKKNIAIISTILLSVFGAPITFYMTNLVMNSVSNYDTPTGFIGFTSSLPALLISVVFIFGVFYFLRSQLYKDNLKRLTKVYGIVFMCFSVIGIVCTILSATLVYGNNFLINYPFFAYHIVLLGFHFLLCILGCFMTFRWQKKIEENGPVHTVTFGYVLKTILISLIIFFIFYKVGGLFLSPIFADPRTLSDTYCFYATIVILGLLYTHFVLDVFGFYTEKKSLKIYIASTLLILSLVFYGQIFFTQWNNQGFTNSISMFNPIGRLLKFPYESILQFLCNFVLVGFGLGNAIVDYKNYKSNLIF